MVNKLIGVYKITSKSTGKFYIGSSSTSIKRRWDAHLRLMRRGTHHNSGLQLLYDTYGDDDLLFEIISSNFNDASSIQKEEQRILNVHYGSEHCINECLQVSTRLGSKQSDRAKALISKVHKGKPKSDIQKQKMSQSQKGREFSKETRHRMSESAKIKVFSDSHKSNISDSSKRMWSSRSKEQNQLIADKIRQSNTGQSFSDERREKISIALKAHWNNKRGLNDR